MSEWIDGQIVKADEGKTAVAAIVAPAYTPIVARVPIAVRAAVMEDLPFIDRMQKAHSKELGFLPMAALEGKVRLGQVLIAEIVGSGKLEVGSEEIPSSSLPTSHYQLPTSLPVGYLIAADRYQKRDEIGYVTQINVVPEYRRSLVAAQLLQAQFDRSAYGCRLYCCWCAQDLKANEFWEAMGFTAIAFRTGSMTKGKKKTPRVHIFWQKKIRADDSTAQWWYPSQTGGGELREDRLVFPIMAGVHWREVGPIVLDGGVPDAEASTTVAVVQEEIPPMIAHTSTKTAGLHPALPSETSFSPLSPPPSPLPRKKRTKAAPPAPVVLVSPRLPGSPFFEWEGVPLVTTPPETRATPKAKTPRPKPAAKKIDPRLTAMSRELRDQWTERAEAIVEQSVGKHDVKRIAASTTPFTQQLRLEQAA